MDENSLFTPFDEITQTRELQMLKTIIPVSYTHLTLPTNSLV